MKIKLAVLLTALVFASLALGQATLGNIVKLGSSTTAGLPVSSSTIAGGLIYVSDDAGILWNNGSAWQPLTSGGGSSSVNYWVDAGNGATYSYNYISNPDGGARALVINTDVVAPGGVWTNLNPGLILRGNAQAGGYDTSSVLSFEGAANGAWGSIFATQQNSLPPMGQGLNILGGGSVVGPLGITFGGGMPGSGMTRYGDFSTSGVFTVARAGTATPPGNVAISIAGGTQFNFGYGAIFADNAGSLRSTIGLASAIPSGQNGFRCVNDGCRMDLGTGTLDYWTGNGTNILTPGAVTIGSFATGSLPAAATVGAGGIAYDSTLAQPTFSNGSAWIPMAKEFVLSGFRLAGAIGTTIVAQNRMQNPGVLRRLTATTAAVGVGVGTFTVDVYNATTTTTLCTSSAIACTAAVGGVFSVQCNAAFTTFDDITLRVNDSGCGTAPAINIAADFGGF